MGGYLLRRVLGALAVAAAFAVLGWFQNAYAYNASGGTATSGTPGTVRYSWRTYPGDPGSNTIVDNETHLSAASLCQSSFTAGKCITMNGAGTYTFHSIGGGTYCQYTKSGGTAGGAGCGSAWSYVKNPQACPAGFTNVGGTCTENYYCPSGGTLSGSVCNCPAGQADTGSSCVVPPTCDPPKYLNATGTACACPTGYSKLVEMDVYGFKSPTAWTGSLACTGGCLLSTGKSTCGGSGCWTEYTGGMGQTCTTENPKPSGSTEVSDEHPDATCLKGGGTPGTVGGVSVCLDKNTGGVPTTTTGAPTTQTKTKDNGDGTSTKEVTTQTPVTVCTGTGSCQTTTTTTTTTTVINNSTGLPVAGNVPTTDTTVKEGEGPPGACDPSKEDCEPKSQFGGSCGGFTCSGDAIQCAIARQQHQAYCDQFGDVGTGLSKADALADWTAGSNGLVTGTGRVGNTSTSASTAFATTERAYGAASLSDWNVGGITIPLSHMNTPLSYLGYIVLVFSTLWGAQIMFGAGRLGS